MKKQQPVKVELWHIFLSTDILHCVSCLAFPILCWKGLSQNVCCIPTLLIICSTSLVLPICDKFLPVSCCPVFYVVPVPWFPLSGRTSVYLQMCPFFKSFVLSFHLSGFLFAGLQLFGFGLFLDLWILLVFSWTFQPLLVVLSF